MELSVHGEQFFSWAWVLTKNPLTQEFCASKTQKTQNETEHKNMVIRPFPQSSAMILLWHNLGWALNWTWGRAGLMIST